MVPETEDAMMRFVPVPTATDGVTPRKISSGVMRNPPPHTKHARQQADPAAEYEQNQRIG